MITRLPVLLRAPGRPLVTSQGERRGDTQTPGGGRGAGISKLTSSKGSRRPPEAEGRMQASPCRFQEPWVPRPRDTWVQISGLQTVDNMFSCVKVPSPGLTVAAALRDQPVFLPSPFLPSSGGEGGDPGYSSPRLVGSALTYPREPRAAPEPATRSAEPSAKPAHRFICPKVFSLPPPSLSTYPRGLYLLFMSLSLAHRETCRGTAGLHGHRAQPHAHPGLGWGRSSVEVPEPDGWEMGAQEGTEGTRSIVLSDFADKTQIQG